MFGRKGEKKAGASVTATFDLLRSRVETDIERPAVVVITSSAPEDGRECAARGLAQSLARTGYGTLFVDASTARRGTTPTLQGLDVEEIAQRFPAVSANGTYATLPLTDTSIQRSSNQRSVEGMLRVLRTKFDYLIVAADCGLQSSFAMSLVASSTAVLVTVRVGRHQLDSDARLSANLDRIGDRFLGVVALDANVIDTDSATFFPAIAPETVLAHRSQPEIAVERKEFAEPSVVRLYERG